MSLSPHEERVAAEIEEDLRARDTTWSRRVDELSAALGGMAEQTNRRAFSPLLVAVACLTGGVTFLLASRHAWSRVKLALASGLPGASVRIALVLAACAAFAAALLLVRAAWTRRQEIVDGAQPEAPVASPR